uniref:Uncharacterized protein n=1 Tax=Opuntia streptacantha TaxID=393608 RepID=A0A7C8ZLU6_OPUST
MICNKWPNAVNRWNMRSTKTSPFPQSLNSPRLERFYSIDDNAITFRQMGAYIHKLIINHTTIKHLPYYRVSRDGEQPWDFKWCFPKIPKAISGDLVEFRDVEEEGKGRCISSEVAISRYVKRFRYGECSIAQEVNYECRNRGVCMEELTNIGIIVME